MTTLICLAISVRAKVLHDPLVQYYFYFIFSRSEFMWQYWRACCSGKGRGSTETEAVRQSQRTETANQSQHISFFGRWAFIKPRTNRVICVCVLRKVFVNNVNNVKNNAIFEPPSTRACSSTPQKLNQDFVKENKRTLLKCHAVSSALQV